MTRSLIGTRQGFFTRCVAAVALVAVYLFSLVALSGLAITTGATSAEARGRGRGRGFRGRGFRGRGWRGRGWGPSVGIYGRNCWWSPRRGRWVCPHY